MVLPRVENATSSEFIRHLCRLLPDQRPSLATARHYLWFAEFPWQQLRQRSMAVPIVPKVKGLADTSNFDIYCKECEEAAIDDYGEWD